MNILSSFSPWTTLLLSLSITSLLFVPSQSLTTTPPNVILLSLQASTDERFSKPVKQVWEWKDAVLGDGLDKFVPKPQTLTALQDLLPHDASVISNCARFEIVVSCSRGIAVEKCRKEISRIVLEQARNCKGQTSLFRKFDRPEDILEDIEEPVDDADVDQVDGFWTIIEGHEAVCRHLCTVACGMALRPSRPGRDVPFRPFSSRDAHVMQQIKRASDISPNPRLFQAALKAGKRARNENFITELDELRQYGTGNTKYDRDVPEDLLNRVVDVSYWYCTG